MRLQPIRFKIEELDNQNEALKILLLLRQHQELYNNQLIDLGVNDGTLKKARIKLLNLKLIKMEERKEGRVERIYCWLTELGKEVADHINSIEQLLPEEEEE